MRTLGPEPALIYRITHRRLALCACGESIRSRSRRLNPRPAGPGVQGGAVAPLLLEKAG